jgi:hypothetical protein
MLSRMPNYTEFPPSRSLVDYQYNTVLVFFSRNSQNKIPSIAKAKLQSRSAIHSVWGWKVDVFGQMSSPIDIQHEDRSFLLLSLPALITKIMYVWMSVCPRTNQSSMNLPEGNPVAKGDTNLSGVLSRSVGARRAQPSSDSST